MHIQNLMNSLWDIRIFLGLVPKESPCTSKATEYVRTALRTSILEPRTATRTHYASGRSYGRPNRSRFFVDFSRPKRNTHNFINIPSYIIKQNSKSLTSLLSSILTESTFLTSPSALLSALHCLQLSLPQGWPVTARRNFTEVNLLFPIPSK